MIYGYVSRDINEYGLKQMREISVSAEPAVLRELAAFLTQTADEIEAESHSAYRHRHATTELRKSVGCDVVVLNPDV